MFQCTYILCESIHVEDNKWEEHPPNIANGSVSMYEDPLEASTALKVLKEGLLEKKGHSSKFFMWPKYGEHGGVYVM